jgi:hypothetical protein
MITVKMMMRRIKTKLHENTTDAQAQRTVTLSTVTATIPNLASVLTGSTRLFNLPLSEKN